MALRRYGARTLIIVGVIALSVAAAVFAASRAEAKPLHQQALAPIRIGISTWDGYIGLVVASKEGYWKKHGLDVKYTVIEDPGQRFAAFKSGSLNAVATSVDTFARYWVKGIQAVQVLGLDASVGGDGIVATKDITTVSQLKGQKIGVNVGSVSQWLLAYALTQNHLSLKDVTMVDMTSGDAGAAFVAGRIKAAVTWQPWLSKAEASSNGHILVSTKQYPTIVADQVGFDRKFIKEHPDSVKAFIDGYSDALKLIRTNPNKAFADAKDYLGQTSAEIKATLLDLRLWSIPQSRAYYGTAAKPGAIYKIFGLSSKFWKDIGDTKSLAPAKQAIDGSFLQAR
jgi:NitT/TauT family transport system substrate-binding protein